MHAHCVIFGLFPFGRRSRGHRGLPHAQNYSSISMGKSMYPIILRGVSLETTPLTRTSDVKSVCVHSGRWHTARYSVQHSLSEKQTKLKKILDIPDDDKMEAHAQEMQDRIADYLKITSARLKIDSIKQVS